METAIKFQLLTLPFTKPPDIIASMINLNELVGGLLVAFLYFMLQYNFYSKHLWLLLIVSLKGMENSHHKVTLLFKALIVFKKSLSETQPFWSH